MTGPTQPSNSIINPVPLALRRGTGFYLKNCAADRRLWGNRSQPQAVYDGNLPIPHRYLAPETTGLITLCIAQKKKPEISSLAS
ncbi:hypothetical protein [Levilactobacillus senmaizukei]|uniref:hypothetical protein n=1 Tax=Levilactobacillus senmaizukei TaxID=431273 RepID=UPI00138F3132|nr:hypothetical protein [Levilactobacillus senmaizukei]